MSTALSIRDRAVLAEQERVANAKLALAPHDTAHEINVMVDSGSSLDDHRTESGYCPTCKLMINRTYNLVNGEVEDSLMSVEQRTLLEPDMCRHCDVVLTDENTHQRLGCCIDCRETAYDEYLRYGRDDE